MYEEMEELINGLANNIDSDELMELLSMVKDSVKIQYMPHRYLSIGHKEDFSPHYSDRFILLKKALHEEDYDIVKLHMKSIFNETEYIDENFFVKIFMLFEDAICRIEQEDI